MIKILLIDDVNECKNMQVCDNIEFCIERFKAPLHAFNYIIKNLPDGIVINMENTTMDSKMVFERVRNMPAGRDIPVLLMGGDKSVYEELLHNGNTKHIKNTQIDEEVLRRLERTLSLKPQEDNQTILLVDDSPVVLDTVKVYLEAHYMVDAIASASVAIEYLERKTPDVIILDISMPEMDGITLMKKIREIPTCQNVPVLFQTGLAAMEKVKECMELGAVGYIIKPVNKNNLLERIATVLNNKQVKETIMLIDNYSLGAANLETMLNNEYNVIGEEASMVALSVLEEKQIDYIFINMDNASIYLEKIREKSRKKNIPIVLISVDKETEYVKKEFHDECKYILKSPLEIDEVEEALSVLSNRAMEERNFKERSLSSTVIKEDNMAQTAKSEEIEDSGKKTENQENVNLNENELNKEYAENKEEKPQE